MVLFKYKFMLYVFRDRNSIYACCFLSHMLCVWLLKIIIILLFRSVWKSSILKQAAFQHSYTGAERYLVCSSGSHLYQEANLNKVQINTKFQWKKPTWLPVAVCTVKSLIFWIGWFVSKFMSWKKTGSESDIFYFF